MDSSKSDDRKAPESAESATRLDRRKFLGTVAATAGGLLLAIVEDKAGELLTVLRRNYPRAEIIGRVTARGEKSISVR